MNPILNYTPSTKLNQAIQRLQEKNTENRKLLNEQFHTSIENLKPSNFLKNTCKSLFEDPDLNRTLIYTGLGWVAGCLIQRWSPRKNSSIPTEVLQMAGTLIQMGARAFRNKHFDSKIPETTNSENGEEMASALPSAINGSETPV